MLDRSTFARHLSTAGILVSMLGSVGLGGCVTSTSAEPDAAENEDLSATPHPFTLGMSNEVSGFEHFLATAEKAKIELKGPHLCHVYTYWDVARNDVNPDYRTVGRKGLLAFFASAEPLCDQVLVTLHGPHDGKVTNPPAAADFEAGFEAFLDWTEAGQPLAAWKGKLAFTAWNEPNNPAGDGNALLHDLSPEQAAEYYLRARKHCTPADGCEIAAGDFATNGAMGEQIGQNCQDDRVSGDTTARCAKPSPYNPHDEPPTYLDRYKTHIVRNAAANGLGATFTPEHWAYHPWHDVNSYLDSWAPCSTYDDCVTRRILVGLGGPWEHADIWDTEIGVGLQSKTLADNALRQPCTAAFLVQLTDLSPRFDRVYFMKYEAGNGPLLASATSFRNAGRVIAAHEPSFTSKAGKCEPTGMSLGK